MTDRKEKLLTAARERLSAKDPEATDDHADDPGRQMMYRGQVVRRPGSSTPGGANSVAEVRAALEKLKKLYHDGLITRSEAEKKRAELLEGLEQ